jgi:uracil-DNA glycosylase
MTAKYLFIGQAPSRETEGKPPFTGKCGSFLAGLMGLTQEEMLATHDFLNVLDHYPGKGVGGDKFPMVEATVKARKMLPTLRGRSIILLGANVARAFGAKQFSYLTQYEIRNPENLADIIVPWMVVIPHPSGINRHWNKPANRDVVRKFFSSLPLIQL